MLFHESQLFFFSLCRCSVPGKLNQFISDLHSGKLHKDFHNPPPPVSLFNTLNRNSLWTQKEGKYLNIFGYLIGYNNSRATACDVTDMTSSIETNTKFDFLMARSAASNLTYRSMLYSSHSDSSSRILILLC